MSPFSNHMVALPTSLNKLRKQSKESWHLIIVSKFFSLLGETAIKMAKRWEIIVRYPFDAKLVLQIRAFVGRIRLLISRSSVFNCHIWTFALCVFVFFPRWFASQPRSEATARLFSYLFFSRFGRLQSRHHSISQSEYAYYTAHESC